MIPVNNMYNFFDDLPAPLRAALDEVSLFREAEQGETLVRAGRLGVQLYQLVEGEVKYCSWNTQGRETVAAHMKRGDWIGLTEIYTGLPAMSDVVALTKVKLRVIQHRDFEALVERHPILARCLLRLFGLRFSAMYHQAQDRYDLSLKERLLKTLYMLAFSHGKTLRHQQEILIEMSQEELSKLIVAARQNLNKLLKELEREGLLRVNYGSITLLGLHHLAERYGYLLDTPQPAPSYST